MAVALGRSDMLPFADPGCISQTLEVMGGAWGASMGDSGFGQGSTPSAARAEIWTRNQDVAPKKIQVLCRLGVCRGLCGVPAAVTPHSFCRLCFSSTALFCFGIVGAARYWVRRRVRFRTYVSRTSPLLGEWTLEDDFHD